MSQICSSAYFVVSKRRGEAFADRATKLAGAESASVRFKQLQLRGQKLLSVPSGHTLIGVMFCGEKLHADPREAIRLLSKEFRRY